MRFSDDQELRARFQRLRDEDRADAPAFRAMVARAELHARAPRRAGFLSPLWMAAAATILLAVGVALGRQRRGEAAREQTDSWIFDVAGMPTVGTWTPPTASLLRTSDRALRAPAPILSSILDGVTGTPARPSGD